MGDDLVEELEAEATRLSGRSLDKGCVDSGLAANLAAKAAADLARLRAENEALRTERDEAREVFTVMSEEFRSAALSEAVRASVGENLPKLIAARAAAEAKAARLETALTDMIALAEADHVCLVSWNGSGSGMNYEGIMATARAALEAKP